MLWKKALQTIILASSLWMWWCHEWCSTRKVDTEIHKWNISALDIISKKTEDDDAEKKLYSTVMKELFEAAKKRNMLFENYPTLQNKISYIPYSQLIALIIKETKLQFISDGWDAFGYGQLERWARNHISTMLRQAWVKEKFDPIHNHIDNLVYMLLYFWYLKKEGEEAFPTVKEEDRMLFAFACYNGGKHKIWFLYEKAWKPDTREKFATYVTQKIMKIKHAPTLITDPVYNVPNYKDYFWDITKYQNDNAVKIKGTYNGHSIIVEQKKAYIIIRYVEIIKAINTFL